MLAWAPDRRESAAMPRPFALPEDKVPCPSGRFRRRRSAGGRDRGQESSNRLSRNALSAGRPLAASPRARSFRAKSTPTSTRHAPAGSNSASRCSKPRFHLAGFERRDRVLAQILGANDPSIAGDRLARVGWPGGFARDRIGLLLGRLKAMTRRSRRLPIIATRRPQVNRAIFAPSHVENRLEIAYSHISHYSHRSKP